MQTTLLHLAAPIATILIVLIVLRAKGKPIIETLALRWPSRKQVGIWVPVFIVLLVVEEYIYTIAGMAEGKAWGDRYSVVEMGARVLGMVLLAPLAEEMVFRGLLFKRILDTKLGGSGAVVITALVFAGIHIQYGPAELAFVFTNGIFYGITRYYSKSIVLPLLFHSLGNLYVAFERITGSGFFY